MPSVNPSASRNELWTMDRKAGGPGTVASFLADELDSQDTIRMKNVYVDDVALAVLYHRHDVDKKDRKDYKPVPSEFNKIKDEIIKENNINSKNPDVIPDNQVFKLRNIIEPDKNDEPKVKVVNNASGPDSTHPPGTKPVKLVSNLPKVKVVNNATGPDSTHPPAPDKPEKVIVVNNSTGPDSTHPPADMQQN